MYRTETLYKIQLKRSREEEIKNIKAITYTAYIIEEDEISIKIKTIRDEVLIITKSSVRQSMEVQE